MGLYLRKKRLKYKRVLVCSAEFIEILKQNKEKLCGIIFDD